MVKTLGSRRHRKLIDLLIAKREAANMTQSQLAAALGEYQSFVARLESGERRVDVVEFIKISEILGVEAAAVLRQVAATEE